METARKKGGQPSAHPTVHIIDEGNLDPISLQDEDKIIFGSESPLKACVGFFGEVISRSVFIDGWPFLHQGSPNEL